MAFPSSDWAAAFREALNHSDAFREAAAAWEADLLFLVRPTAPDVPAPAVRLGLNHGVCESAVYVPDGRGIAAEFVFEGTAENWHKLLHRELEPLRPFLDGTFKIRGNLAKAMRFTRAAKELVDTAASVPGAD